MNIRLTCIWFDGANSSRDVSYFFYFLKIKKSICKPYYTEQRWEFIKERFQEKKKENTISTKEKSKIPEKKRKNTLSTTEKSKIREKKHAFDQEKSKIQEKERKHAYDQEKK